MLVRVSNLSHYVAARSSVLYWQLSSVCHPSGYVVNKYQLRLRFESGFKLNDYALGVEIHEIECLAHHFNRNKRVSEISCIYSCILFITCSQPIYSCII